MLQKTKEARPGIIIASVPLPYQIEEDLITKNAGSERYIPFLVNEAKRLEKAGADFLVMPCNSLHVFIKEIRNAVDIPVLSIVEETVKFLKKNNLNKVGIVSTSATIKNIRHNENLCGCNCRRNIEIKVFKNIENCHQNTLKPRCALPPSVVWAYNTAYAARGSACASPKFWPFLNLIFLFIYIYL